MSWNWNILPLISVFIYGSHSVLLNLCKDETGSIPFSSAAVVLLSELVKLLFSLALWLPEFLSHALTNRGRSVSFDVSSDQSVEVLPLKSSWVFAIPAVLYAINNNVVVVIQHHMDPATFQVLSNLKIASTSILYHVVLQNRMSRRQWTAIGLLLAGSMCNSIGGIRTGGSSVASKEMFITLPGLVLLLVYCSISGISGIYTEYVLKKQKKVSLHQQNTLLYMYGICLNLVAYLLEPVSSLSGAAAFFHGFSPWTLIIILTQAVNGLIMASIFKHGNNIIRLFIISSSMLVTTVLSVFLFSLHLTSYFYVSLASILLALCLFYSK